MGVDVMQCTTFIVEKFRSRHLRDTCRHLTANDINHPCLSVAQHHPIPSDKLACVISELNGLLRKKHIGHIYQSAAPGLRKTRHICQICALWKFVSGSSIFSNYVQSDAIKSHSFHISNPISVQVQNKSVKSVFHFSRPNFWQFLGRKS